MAETKRYYWIKLKEDFFQDDAISWIEEQKDGKEMLPVLSQIMSKIITKSRGACPLYW